MVWRVYHVVIAVVLVAAISVLAVMHWRGSHSHRLGGEAQNEANLQLEGAARKNDTARMIELINSGADPNGRHGDVMGVGAMHDESMDVLLSHGGRPECLTVVMATTHHHPEMVEKLIAHGAKIDYGDCSALRYAVKAGDVAIARILMAHGADINQTNGNQASPIAMARASGNQAMIAALEGR